MITLCRYNLKTMKTQIQRMLTKIYNNPTKPGFIGRIKMPNFVYINQQV